MGNAVGTALTKESAMEAGRLFLSAAACQRLWGIHEKRARYIIGLGPERGADPDTIYRTAYLLGRSELELEARRVYLARALGKFVVSEQALTATGEVVTLERQLPPDSKLLASLVNRLSPDAMPVPRGMTAPQFVAEAVEAYTKGEVSLEVLSRVPSLLKGLPSAERVMDGALPVVVEIVGAGTEKPQP